MPGPLGLHVILGLSQTHQIKSKKMMYVTYLTQFFARMYDSRKATRTSEHF